MSRGRKTVKVTFHFNVKKVKVQMVQGISSSHARSSSTHSLAADGMRSRASARACRQETGLSARVAQLGPTLGTAVAAVEAVEDLGKATYETAISGLKKIDRAASDAADGVVEAAHAVSDAASTVAETFSSGASKLGKMLDLSA